MTYTPEDLATMSEDEFKLALTGDHDVLGAIGSRVEFAPFVDPQAAHRTFGFLADLQGQLKASLALYGEGPSADQNWVLRTRKFLALVESRMSYTQACIRIHTRDSRVSNQNAAAPWKIFAHKLCEALDGAPDAETQDLLDSIMSPFPPMTAGEWLIRRLEKNPERTGVNV